VFVEGISSKELYSVKPTCHFISHLFIGGKIKYTIKIKVIS